MSFAQHHSGPNSYNGPKPTNRFGTLRIPLSKVPPFNAERKNLENPHPLGTTPSSQQVWAGPRALLPVPRKAAPSWDRDHSNTKHPKP